MGLESVTEIKNGFRGPEPKLRTSKPAAILALAPQQLQQHWAPQPLLQLKNQQ